MNLFESYKRWRHSRGFGVHSPFAYKLVKEALHPARNYSFYADFDPRMKTPAGCRSLRPEILLRLIIFLKEMNARENNTPALKFCVSILGRDFPQAFTFAIRSAGAVAHKNTLNGELLIICKDYTGRIPDLDAYKAILLLNPDKKFAKKDAQLQKGLIIDALHYRLIINRPVMALTRLTLP